jgi:hypothetical protein
VPFELSRKKLVVKLDHFQIALKKMVVVPLHEDA